MGFKRTKQLHRLVWPEGHEFHGLEVDMGPVSIGSLMEMLTMAEAATPGSGQADPEAIKAAVDQLNSFVADKLEAWNLEIDGPDGTDVPVPADIEGVRAQGLDLIMAIIGGWVSAMTEVSDPLDKPSTDGLPSVDLSTIPVTSLAPQTS